MYEHVIALSWFCDTENKQWASGVFNQQIASDYFLTSYLNAFILLNYNDILPPSHRGGVLTACLRRRKMGPERAKVAISVV